MYGLDGREEEAEKHYRRALVLTSPTDDILESDYPEAHHNYAIFSETESNLLKAKKHSERSVELWIRRDRYLDALSDSRLLIRVSKRLGEEQDAIDYCQRALGIAERRGFPDHHPIVRELRELCSV